MNMEPEFVLTIKDENDHDIQVGDICLYGAPDDDDLPDYQVRVAAITDLDGDVDDEGRSIQINPTVVVKFVNGDEEVCSTYTEYRGRYEMIFVVSDLAFIERPEHSMKVPD